MTSGKRHELTAAGLLDRWPLDREGALPQILADRMFIYDAFFLHLPVRIECSASALRRGLKHAAKQLDIPFDRTNTGFDQRERD